MFGSGIVHLIDGIDDHPRNALSLSIDLHRQLEKFPPKTIDSYVSGAYLSNWYYPAPAFERSNFPSRKNHRPTLSSIFLPSIAYSLTSYTLVPREILSKASFGICKMRLCVLMSLVGLGI